ncbi:MAG: hypothetical protein ABR907_15135 [Terracidiphilus sp.]|jgi:hypothetical protein
MFKMRIILVASFVLAGLVPAQSQTAQKSWPWPPIPGCLADPEIKTLGATDYSSPVCAVYDELLDSNQIDIALQSARRLNGQMDGVLYPAFLPGTEAVGFIVTDQFSKAFTGSFRLVRVSGKSISARSGSWWTTISMVTDSGKLMTAEEIRAKLALTDTPACIAYADSVKTGVRALMGVVAPAFDEPGGGAEFWFPPDAVISTTVHAIPGATGCDVQ